MPSAEALSLELIDLRPTLVPAVCVLPRRALVLGVALREARLGELGDVLGRMEEIDQLAVGVLLGKGPVVRRAVGDADPFPASCP
jgi:hypothetical protein